MVVIESPNLILPFYCVSFIHMVSEHFCCFCRKFRVDQKIVVALIFSGHNATLIFIEPWLHARKQGWAMWAFYWTGYRLIWKLFLYKDTITVDIIIFPFFLAQIQPICYQFWTNDKKFSPYDFRVVRWKSDWVAAFALRICYAECLKNFLFSYHCYQKIPLDQEHSMSHVSRHESKSMLFCFSFEAFKLIESQDRQRH